ncbi:MAG: alpha/beta fold hydrolase [Magnetococcales bacterium]|nr:alpha/beta fold hydrolase [Magnetococcales bacterium]MBF0323257.1 alpha/beta fold hydrolase [Magnetococcales bacterium]
MERQASRSPFKNHVTAVGKGFPLLCLPGFGSASWVFAKMAENLSGAFEVIMPDNRGMGRSPPSPGPYAMADLAQDALQVMDDLGHERFGVIGLSMGGFIAQILTLAAPERVAALALLCTTSSGPEFETHFPLMPEDQLRAIYTLDPLARARLALDASLVPFLHQRYQTIYDYMIQMRTSLPENPAEVFLQYSAVANFMKHPLPLEEIRCPVLVMSGDKDILVPPENAHLLVKKISGATLHFIPETDHLFFLEKASDVAHLLGEFFQDARRSSPGGQAPASP